MAYQPGDARAYIEKSGWQFRTSGDEIVLRNCPLCGRSDWKFYVNSETGAWLDHHAGCGKKGSWNQLLRELGEQPDHDIQPIMLERKKHKKHRPLEDFLPLEVALADDPDALAYLAKRGFTSETIKTWHLGLKDDPHHGRGIGIPMITRDGGIADVKYRSVPPSPKMFWRAGGGETILFGEHLLDCDGSEHDRLYIAEAELGAITLWQEGYRPAVSAAAGAGNFLERYYDVITAYNPREIVVVYDSDAAGRKGAEAIAKKFSERIVRNIDLPVKDINEFFYPQEPDNTPHTKAEFDALLGDSKPIGFEQIVPLVEIFDQLEAKLLLEGTSFDGYKTQFDELNELLGGGLWRGQLTTITGPSGVGKTSLVRQTLLWLGLQGVPVYQLCLEMPNEMMLLTILEQMFKKSKLDITADDLARYRPSIENLRMYLGEQARDLAAVEGLIRKAVTRCDCEVIAFDHVNYFAKRSDNETKAISDCCGLLKELAKELRKIILLIAQPVKFDQNERVMVTSDLKGSSAIEQDSDVVIIAHRKKNRTQMEDFGKTAAKKDNYSPIGLLRVDKSRYSCGGEVYLRFEGPTQTWREFSPEELAMITRNEGRDDD